MLSLLIFFVSFLESFHLYLSIVFALPTITIAIAVPLSCFWRQYWCPLLFTIAFKSEIILGAIKKRSHEPKYKTNKKKEAERLRVTTFANPKLIILQNIVRILGESKIFSQTVYNNKYLDSFKLAIYSSIMKTFYLLKLARKLIRTSSIYNISFKRSLVIL